jgi:hypothetical protein
MDSRVRSIMKLPTSAPTLARLRLSLLAVAAALVVSAGGLLVTGSNAQAAAVPVPLRTAESFVVLAGAGITNTGPTVLTGTSAASRTRRSLAPGR